MAELSYVRYSQLHRHAQKQCVYCFVEAYTDIVMQHIKYKVIRFNLVRVCIYSYILLMQYYNKRSVIQ